MDRRSTDLTAYEELARRGPCFICAFLAGDPAFRHETVYEDEEHVAFLDRYPTLPGKLLVAPKAHVEQVVRELDEAAYTRLMLCVRTVALAMEDVLAPERTYLLSLGSQQGNTHLHWHVAGLNGSSTTRSWPRTAYWSRLPRRARRWPRGCAGRCGKGWGTGLDDRLPRAPAPAATPRRRDGTSAAPAPAADPPR
ncbi:HIT family protein [Streptomyces scopuliridis]|uniref:HIT family protein n=1 Tax=Streptomyces scopuliridis TaxID=452529 RepID=UPI0036910C00